VHSNLIYLYESHGIELPQNKPVQPGYAT